LFNCPLSFEKASRLVEQLNLTSDSYIVDVGCGEGEFLIQVAEQYNITGIGIDNNSNLIDAADQKAKTRISSQSISFVYQDAQKFDWTVRKADLIISIGSEFVLGGYRQALQLFSDCLATARKVLLGTVFWKQEPSIEYLRLMGEENPHFNFLTTVNIAIEEGFIPLYLCRSNQDEWDDFESRHAQKRYLAAIQNADEEAFEQIQSWQRGYLRWGSDTMGFVFLLLQKQ
jgi:cyclopropane fatty-acyl-phospholipid synthase-like methyltransferase